MMYQVARPGWQYSFEKTTQTRVPFDLAMIETIEPEDPERHGIGHSIASSEHSFGSYDEIDVHFLHSVSKAWSDPEQGLDDYFEPIKY